MTQSGQTGDISSTDSQGIRGATDGTEIGNTGDRLKVDATIASFTVVQAFSDRMKNEYSGSTINLSGAAYQNVYSYSGSGYLCSFVIQSSSDDLEMKLVVDGQTVFENITSKNLNDLDIRTLDPNYFFGGSGAGTFFYSPTPFPIRYDTSVLLQARRVTGGSMSINRYLMNIVKET